MSKGRRKDHSMTDTEPRTRMHSRATKQQRIASVRFCGRLNCAVCVSEYSSSEVFAFLSCWEESVAEVAIELKVQPVRGLL